MVTSIKFLKRAFFLLMIVLMSGCSDPKPIKIGMVAGLSGRRSQVGVSARNAVLMAVKLVNDKGGINGRKVELIVKDNKGEVDECGRVIHELLNEGAIAIIGPVISKMAQIALKTTKDKNILLISPTVSMDSIKDIDDQFLRVMQVASKEAKLMSRVVINDGHTEAAIVYDSSNKEYAEPIYKMFQDSMVKAGHKITYVDNMSDTENQKITRIAQNVIDSNPSALYIISSGIDAAFLCQQIRKKNSTIKFYGSYWVKTGNIIEQGGSSVEGMVVGAPYEGEEKSDKYNAFAKVHEEMFKSKPNFVAIYSFEAAQVLFTGIEKSGELNALMIKNAILKQKAFEGIEEKFEINEYGDATRSSMVLEIKNGAFIRRS